MKRHLAEVGGELRTRARVRKEWRRVVVTVTEEEGTQKSTTSIGASRTPDFRDKEESNITHHVTHWTRG